MFVLDNQFQVVEHLKLSVCQSNGIIQLTPILLYSHKQFYICLWEYFYALIAVIITTTMIHKIQSNRKANPPAYHIDIQRNTYSCNQCKGNTDNTQSNRHRFSQAFYSDNFVILPAVMPLLINPVKYISEQKQSSYQNPRRSKNHNANHNIRMHIIGQVAIR